MASTEPRNFIRGKPDWDRINEAIASLASTEPRNFIRGKISHSLWVVSALKGFNGAAEFHPRKVCHDDHEEICFEGFNGAAEFHPRKDARRLTKYFEVRNASTEPRNFIRGKRPLCLFTWRRK